MSRREADIRAALERGGFVVRDIVQNRHMKVTVEKDGYSFFVVTGVTPSDRRAHKNLLTDANKMLARLKANSEHNRR